MPLNPKGRSIKKAMQQFYGKKQGEKIFYASENSGKIDDVTEGCSRESVSDKDRARFMESLKKRRK